MNIERVALKEVGEVVSALAGDTAVKATKYIAPNLIVRGVRIRFGKKILKHSNFQIVLTVGRPNYVEREFIALCKKAGEPFPVKNVQIKPYNPKKGTLKKHGKR